MQLNLEWLRTFKAIYETGTLSAAAQELYISQPGVSLHLNSLEAYTGYKLFERSSRRMIPTEKGKIFYNFIQEPIKKLETAEQLFHKRSELERPTISLGMCFETFQYTLEEHIPSLEFNLIIKFGEYPQMQHDLDQGMLDLIVTPEKGNQKNLVYQAFASERIVLIAGGSTDTEELLQLLADGNVAAASKHLKQQYWYSTAADMEHLKAFWTNNFGEHPDFRPNYIVPNISSIIRCLSVGAGYSIVPDFLCLDAIASGKIKQVWQGSQVLENTLYFGTRKNTTYQNELRQLEAIFRQKWQHLPLL
jgi:DNA-binding transcriptional LysR family regulator